MVSAIEQNLQDYLLERNEYQSDGFTVDSIDKAEWCMRKLAKLAQEDAADNAMAQTEIERIQAWLAERQAARQQHRDFFTGHLTRFHQSVLLQDEKAKTIKLPHGALKARKLPDKWEYDERQIIDWAKANGQAETFVRVKEEAVKTAVKEYVKETGEKVPGVTVLSQGIKFDVEVDA